MFEKVALDNFFKVMDEFEKQDGVFRDFDFEKDGFNFELKYSRQDFIKDTSRIWEELTEQERCFCEKNFGFVLHKTLERTTFYGYPNVENVERKELSKGLRELFDKVFAYSYDNCILGLSEINGYLNSIIKIFPEFITAIGKLQHHTHSYTVDVHTLKVLQGVMFDSRYSLLSDDDKRALQIAVLMHDITKKEGEIDKTHPACSAVDAECILERFDISRDLREQVVLLIKQHDWLERYNKNVTSPTGIAKALKDGNNFLMLCILAVADLKAVQRGGYFYDKFCDVLFEAEKEIGVIVQIYKNSKQGAA